MQFPCFKNRCAHRIHIPGAYTKMYSYARVSLKRKEVTRKYTKALQNIFHASKPAVTW